MRNALSNWGKRPDESWRQYRRAVTETLRIMIFHRDLYRSLTAPLDSSDLMEAEPPA